MGTNKNLRQYTIFLSLRKVTARFGCTVQTSSGWTWKAQDYISSLRGFQIWSDDGCTVQPKHVATLHNKTREACTYNVILRHVNQKTTVAVEKQCLAYLYVRACLRVCSCVRARALARACARVALLIQHATRRHIVVCRVSGSTKFFGVVT